MNDMKLLFRIEFFLLYVLNETDKLQKHDKDFL